MKSIKSVAILGSGPAALMAADVLSTQGVQVSIFEKRTGPGRKLLIAGSSGLNITNHLPPSEFYQHYTGSPSYWKKLLAEFSPKDWIQFIENLGIETFKGTSGRYFVKEMKASKLLKTWTNRLVQNGVQFYYEWECEDFEIVPHSRNIQLKFSQAREQTFDAVCFCFGGGSYEPNENPLRWPQIFIKKNLKFIPFSPSNMGFQVKWSPEFQKEADGLPIKNSALTSSRGTRKGEMTITQYGIEGTPVYFVGETGRVFLDLKPDLTSQEILKRCLSIKENLSPIRRIGRQLKLCPGSMALLFHMTPKAVLQNLPLLVDTIKKFPLDFHQSQPLDESISSRGGLSFSELTPSLMLNRFPGVFAAGEMIDWDAPTGGFLIQGCVSQGYSAGTGILKYLAAPSK